MAFAHSKNDSGERHDLFAHLQAVSSLAAQFAAPLDAREAARFLGLWHDLGKLHPDFQRYLLDSEAGKPRRRRSPDHKAAGTQLAFEYLGTLCMIIHGHHGGLVSPSTLKAWLADDRRARTAREALDLALEAWPQIRPGGEIQLPEQLRGDYLDAELFIRLLYSTLVDADYLDTERHFAGAVRPDDQQDMAELWRRFECNQTALTGHRTDPVSTIRHAIYQDCLCAAEGDPGLYRLTVPTGGGKTRSGLGFALKHAMKHGMERVIVAIPFISITEQTAATLQTIFDRPQEAPVVLEHHSAVTFPDDEIGWARSQWTRLTAENWDAPIIVTTTVQLFESLFGNKPRVMRKLHRLANSVIILDEAQSLPAHRLAPILDALMRLTSGYNTTVVLSTATQPAFDAIPAFRELDATEIIPDPARYYAALERVEYRWGLDESLSWGKVAELMCEKDQALTVVNTKRDALALFDEVASRDESALHLSAGMCGAHRRQVLDEVKRRLQDGTPCHLVATQVVESGVDLDFPLVLRAMGPLDAIIQAAGRCNREGRLDRGQVYVFEPEDGHTPPGAYRTATGLARAVLGKGDLDPNSAQAARDYFAQLFNTVNLDRNEIQACRKRLDYPETAQRFQMIDDDTVSVVVRFGTEDQVRRLEETLDHVGRHQGSPRLLMRSLQPYMVNLRRKRAERLLREGLLSEVVPGLLLWLGAYDRQRGLVTDDMRPNDLVT